MNSATPAAEGEESAPKKAVEPEESENDEGVDFFDQVLRLNREDNYGRRGTELPPVRTIEIEDAVSEDSLQRDAHPAKNTSVLMKRRNSATNVKDHDSIIKQDLEQSLNESRNEKFGR